MPEEGELSIQAAMIGILALLAAEREERLAGSEPLRTEVILSDAGIPIREIARVLGKNYQAVQKILWRGRTSLKPRTSDRRKESVDATD